MAAHPLKTLFPPEPTLTENSLPTQKGKIFIVTGANSGLGKELTKILYSSHAKIYMAARSETKVKAAIEDIQRLHPSSTGELIYLHLDLSDLSTIKQSVRDFLAKESRLDVLWNNAGVMLPPPGSKTAQGYELQLGVNSLGTFLFTQLLYPTMVTTALAAPTNSVRVVWVSSSAASGAPKPPIDFKNMDYKTEEGEWRKYERSKVGTILLACEFARRSESEGHRVLHVPLDPGVYPTALQRTAGWRRGAVKMFGRDPKYGGYTELFAGLDTSIKENGVFVIPFGRQDKCRKDLRDEDLGQQYWEWVEAQIKPYE